MLISLKGGFVVVVGVPSWWCAVVLVHGCYSESLLDSLLAKLKLFLYFCSFY